VKKRGEESGGRDGFDLSKVKTVPFRKIERKVSVDLFARPVRAGSRFSEFISSLPSVLAASDLRALQAAILEARAKGRPVVAMVGAHVIKCGLAPILNDLIDRGIFSAVAMNGAGAVHDFEIALFGETSEEVGEGLLDGTFGMSEETGALMNGIINEAAKKGSGIGRALGSYLLARKAKHREVSLMAMACTKEIPATVHVAIGTDVIHQHPSFDGGATGAAAGEDFRRFCRVVSELKDGVVLNLGSAVILPEVFLKALCVVRNLGHEVSNLTAADFDMIRHYRPARNVLERPTLGGGKSFSFTGHHEIMIPLLAAGLVEGSLDKGKRKD